MNADNGNPNRPKNPTDSSMGGGGSLAKGTDSCINGARTTPCDLKPNAGSPPMGSVKGGGMPSDSTNTGQIGGVRDRMKADSAPTGAGSPPMGSVKTGGMPSGPGIGGFTIAKPFKAKNEGGSGGEAGKVDMKSEYPKPASTAQGAKYRSTEKNYTTGDRGSYKFKK